MLSKTSIIEKKILDSIKIGHYAVGAKIPSRQQFMQKYNCSRVTIERVIAKLTNDGYLTSSQGKGTFVLSNKPQNLFSEIKVVSNYNIKYNTDFMPGLIITEEDCKLPIRWISADSAAEKIDILTEKNSIVVWICPNEESIFLMNYIKSKDIPQLLINRDYEGFDYVVTSATTSIKEGLSWLMIEAGREIAFISRPASTTRPYLQRRIIAFYEQCVELNAKLTPGTIFSRPFNNISQDMNEVGMFLFGKKEHPRAIFVMEQELVLPVIMTAERYNLKVGKDFFILNFDCIEELRNINGIGMMRQSYSLFRQEIVNWLNHLKNNRDSPKPFKSEIKTDLIYSN